MSENRKLKVYTLDQVIDMYIGIFGTSKRDKFEKKLNKELNKHRSKIQDGKNTN